jgi:putative ATP-binding cassette transporter
MTCLAEAPVGSRLSRFFSYFRMWWQLIKPFWFHSALKWKALGLLLLTLALSGVFIYASVTFNKMIFRLYDAIEKLNQAAFLHELRYLFILILVIMIPSPLAGYVRGRLSFLWRQWQTETITSSWLSKNRFYQMMLYDNHVENIDQRLADDVRQLCASSLSIFIELLMSSIKIVAFIFVLWNATPKVSVAFFGLGNVYLPLLILLVGIFYPVIVTIVTFILSAPLPQLDFNQEKLEASFRYRLIRIREHREQVALFHSTEWEYTGLRSAFSHIRSNYMLQIKRLTLIGASFTFFINMETIVLLLPLMQAIFAGIIGMGMLMQVNSAYRTLTDAMLTMATEYSALASLAAVVKRLYQAEAELAHVAEHFDSYTLTRQFVQPHFSCHKLDLFLPDGKVLLKGVELLLLPGERLLLTGHSGIGKSTLLRAALGIWPCASGTVALPCGEHEILALTQRPYMPLGSLREGILYPRAMATDIKISETLEAVHLSHLITRLDETEDWGNVLSLGEMQRVMIVRAILHQPRFLCMDEPTASLDRNNEARIFVHLLEQLPGCTFVTISHSDSLRQYHTHMIDVTQWYPNAFTL